MDEFEKIRAFSEQMSQKTEQVLKQETEEVEEQADEQSAEEGPDFLREWSHQEVVEQPASKGVKKAFWCVFALASVLVVCLLFVIYLLLHDPMDNQENVPTISPTPVPVKVKPENPGGMVIPDQDKVIYDRVSQDPVPVKVEQLFPDEDPILPPIEENPETTEVEDIVVPVFVEEEVEKVVETAPAPKVEVKKEEKQPVKEGAVKEVKAEAKTDSKAESGKEVKVQSAPEMWHAQLFSSTDKAKVEKTWKTILAKHKGLLSDMPMNIVKADIAGKGTFYRLQVGDFSTKDRATNLCAKLKKQKQDCVPAK